MSPIVEEVRSFLPLRIHDVDADSGGIIIGGERWRLRINTNWRAMRDETSGWQLSSSSEGRSPGELVGDDVVEIYFQSGQAGFDLSFKTREGCMLEILSDFPYGEWIFSVWSRGDERRIPVFDIEGPLQQDPS